jgi:hypothetical protein
MIQLGACDRTVTQSQCDAYVKQVEGATRVSLTSVEANRDRIVFASHTPDTQQPMTVAAIQKALRERGFFPGGKEDGLCGYRTLSAIRLFQEYVRAVEKLPCVPDGIFGPKSQQHLQRWIDGGLTTEWAPTIERWGAGTLANTEYSAWLALLDQVKAHYTANPNRVLQMVNAFAKASDTRKVAAWDASPSVIHLIGIRRNEASLKFDDIFVLLIKGLVFKFQGSTEPGASSNAAGAPFLVQGQHDYHFGWHQLKYLALRPQGKGVLVVRSKTDFRLDESDLANGLEANGSINIHWGGKGKTADVKSWSEGCQVINGTAYLTPFGGLMDCSAFAAVNNTEVASTPSRTRAAYNVLVDLVTALGSDLPGSTVRYTLLAESDLALSPSLKQGLDDARNRARALLG